MRFRPLSHRRAASVVELALLLPFLVSLLLGMFEISRGILVKEAIINAANRAARTASIPGRNNSDVTPGVAEVLSAAGITGYTVTVRVNGAVADASTAVRGDRVSVQVSVPVARVYWLSGTYLPTTQTLSETVTMMRQG
ncbi:MAG: TadE/TadG family type IV pilus assembly protein [Gemmataceae bacterium]